jgi:hypothetical protein
MPRFNDILPSWRYYPADIPAVPPLISTLFPLLFRCFRPDAGLENDVLSKGLSRTRDDFNSILASALTE